MYRNSLHEFEFIPAIMKSSTVLEVFNKVYRVRMFSNDTSISLLHTRTHNVAKIMDTWCDDWVLVPGVFVVYNIMIYIHYCVRQKSIEVPMSSIDRSR